MTCGPLYCHNDCRPGCICPHAPGCEGTTGFCPDALHAYARSLTPDRRQAIDDCLRLCDAAGLKEKNGGILHIQLEDSNYEFDAETDPEYCEVYRTPTSLFGTPPAEEYAAGHAWNGLSLDERVFLVRLWDNH